MNTKAKIDRARNSARSRNNAKSRQETLIMLKIINF